MLGHDNKTAVIRNDLKKFIAESGSWLGNRKASRAKKFFMGNRRLLAGSSSFFGALPEFFGRWTEKSFSRRDAEGDGLWLGSESH